MRLLVDANLSPRVAMALTDLGHDAIHVVDVGLLSASDTTIAEFGTNEARIIVTSDSDFGTILARTGGGSPSVILLRHVNDVTPPRQVELIEVAMATGAEALASGAIVTMSGGRLRVRNLPIVAR